ncbi:MAG: hypothetical protein LBM71_02995 [Elusimicrobiota bacterium]|jgi:glycerol kinase|nr:hypothetical protein [Elusimicrobiota bacterium]
MKEEIIISLDQGSSSSKAAAFDAKTGLTLAKASAPLNFKASANTYEYDASELLQTQIKALEEVLKALPLGVKPKAMAISSQRSTIVLWDAQTGQPLCPAISWIDGRAGLESIENPTAQEEIHAKTGLYKTPYYSAPKIQWCLKHYPAVKEALHKGRLLVGPVASYLIWHFNKGKVFACDAALAQRTLLFDINKMQWDHDIAKSFAIPLSILPQVRPSAGDFGFYKDIPITVCTGDQQAALAATGVLEKGNACLNYGTGAFFLLNIGGVAADLKGILTSVSWNSLDKKPDYLLEGPINAAGSIFTWLKNLGLNFDQNNLDETIAAAKNPVWFLPALGGLGAPYWDFDTTPVITGLRPNSTAADIVSGAMRSLAFIMADIVFYINNAGFEVKKLQASGGLSVNKTLLNLQSDILQAPILRREEKETSLLGSAYIAALNAGFTTEAWHSGDNFETFSPSLSKLEAQGLYKQWRGFFDWALKQEF